MGSRTAKYNVDQFISDARFSSWCGGLHFHLDFVDQMTGSFIVAKKWLSIPFDAPAIHPAAIPSVVAPM